MKIESIKSRAAKLAAAGMSQDDAHLEAEAAFFKEHVAQHGFTKTARRFGSETVRAAIMAVSAK